MALVSGRPISFRMDLYNPLYVSRPTVEPELFASLRPVTYSGGFGKEDRKPEKPAVVNPTRPAADSVIMGGSGGGAVDEGQLRQLAEQWGKLPAGERARLARD